MDAWEKIIAIQRMQDYIHQHIDDNITLDDICKAAGYSKWHSLRIFREAFRKTPFEYIRALRITNAARNIKSSPDTNILDIALGAGFISHEGFTKAFYAQFGVKPGRYRNHVPRRFFYFEPSSILRDYLNSNAKERTEMAESKRTVTVTIIERPARKLILKRGVTADGYFSLCEEIGCDSWEVLEAIPQAMDDPAFLTLPPDLILPGTSKAAFGVEVPIDYALAIPEGFEIIDLPAHTKMWFQGAPYEDESWYGEAHGEMFRTIVNYKPELYGYEFALDSAPRFNFGASAARGVREMMPVRRLCD